MHILIKLDHFPSFSVSIMSVDSYTAIHVQNVVFMIVSLFLFRMIDPAKSLVQTYITCNIMVFFQVHDHGLLISNKVPYSIGYI